MFRQVTRTHIEFQKRHQ